MFYDRYDSVRIGKIVKKLGFRSFGFGNFGWKWKNVCLSDLRLDRNSRMNPHVAIVGESGGGKSNAAKVIVEKLHSIGANLVILDPHNEYLGTAEAISAEIYDAARNGINLFDLDGMSEREKASEITGLFRRNFRLGDVQSYTLYKCIMKTYSYLGEYGRIPNISNLLFTISVFKRNAKTGEKSILESLEKRLSLLDTGSFAKSTDIERIIRGNSLFLLSNLHTAEAQSIYLEGFLRKIYSKMLTLEKSGRPFLYIVIDEAEKLGDNPILGKIAAEGRKYGIGIIATAQRAKMIDKDLRNNSSLFISFYQREPEELNYVSNFIAGGNELGRFVEVKKGIRNLQRGYAVVADSADKNPLIVHFDKHERQNTSVSFSILQLSRSGISAQELENRMGKICEAAEVNNVVRALISKSELQEYVIAEGRYAGKWYISDARNSAEHDICVNIIGRHLLQARIHNRVYNSSYGPDVIAYCNRKRIAIEYETGLKDIGDTAKMLEKRRHYYPKVITVVNDRVYDEYSRSFPDVLKFSQLDRLNGIVAS